MAEQSHMGYAEALGSAASNPADPRSVGYSLIVKDKEYTVSSCELGIKAQYEQWVRRGARMAATQADEDGDTYEADKLRSLFTTEFALGYYSWGRDGRKITAARRTDPGLRYLLFLLVRRCHPKVTEQDVDWLVDNDVRECLAALEWSLGNSPPPPKNTQTAGVNQTTRTPTTIDGP